MALLTQQEFMQKFPKGDYQKYLRARAANNKMPKLAAQAQAALASQAGSAGMPPTPPAPGALGSGQETGTLRYGGLPWWKVPKMTHGQHVQNIQAAQRAAIEQMAGNLGTSVNEAVLGLGWPIMAGADPTNTTGWPGAGAGVDLNALVTPFNLNNDPGALYQALKGMDPAALQATLAGIPEEVRSAVSGLEMPFSWEYLMSPGFNFTDPSKPFFDVGQAPQSLFPFTGFQAGETGQLAGLSLPEFIQQMYPLGYSYYHRGEGQPALLPSGAPHPGLMFGQANYDETQPLGERFTQSPWRDTDAYKRWIAFGQPGEMGQGAGGGWLHSMYGQAWNPLSNITSGQPMGLSQAQQSILSGETRPEFFNTPWDQVLSSFFPGRLERAALFNDPSQYFVGPYAQWAPGSIDPAVLARLLALASPTPTPP
jgi:hypothetical protein